MGFLWSVVSSVSYWPYDHLLTSSRSPGGAAFPPASRQLQKP